MLRLWRKQLLQVRVLRLLATLQRGAGQLPVHALQLGLELQTPRELLRYLCRLRERGRILRGVRACRLRHWRWRWRWHWPTYCLLLLTYL